MTDTAIAQPEDNLADDILSMLSNSGLTEAQQQTVMVQLIPYIVTRDHKLFTHAYSAGRASV